MPSRGSRDDPPLCRERLDRFAKYAAARIVGAARGPLRKRGRGGIFALDDGKAEFLRDPMGQIPFP